jgi:hypothetical protein
MVRYAMEGWMGGVSADIVRVIVILQHDILSVHQDKDDTLTVCVLHRT